MSDTTSPNAPPAIPVTQIADAAATAEKAILDAPPGTEPSWAKPAIAIFAVAIFAAIAVYAFASGNHEMQLVIEGAAQGMATTAVGYYLGSSSGSAHKTALLAAAPAVTGAST